jgi:excisionase family DNA binding protein
MPDFRNIDPSLKYTPAEAAALKGLSIQTIRAALRSGKLPSIREGTRYYIRGSSLLNWKRANRKSPAGPGREW